MIRIRLLCSACSGLLASVLFSTASAAVKLPAAIGSHMVLQRGVAAPIWGTAAPGEAVTVTFRQQTRSTVADAGGRWLVRLDPLEAGGPDVMTVAGSTTNTLEDVLVGEVWVGSGQSNMAGGTGGYAKGDPVLAALATNTYPHLRLHASRSAGWRVADPAAIQGFSALLFSFGARLQPELDVPVGLIVGAVGGTPAGYWLSRNAFESDPGCKAAIEQYATSGQYEKALTNHQQQVALWEKAAAQAKEQGKAAPATPSAPLKPGVCRGVIGNLYETHIRPIQPYAIRGVLWDQGESGTAVGGVEWDTMMAALIRGWRHEWAQAAAGTNAAVTPDDFPFLFVQKPSGGGCAWDPKDPVTRLAGKFAALPPSVPSDGGAREPCLKLMSFPNTAMVISSDLGGGIHPVAKSSYGARAARVALGAVYGRKVEYCGPCYTSHAIEGSAARVRFTHVGSGLAAAQSQTLQGFAVAGADRKFVWADARIDGETVVVSSPKVAAPVAVRYAWAAQHSWANLFNADGLPAVPFRTDGRK